MDWAYIIFWLCFFMMIDSILQYISELMTFCSREIRKGLSPTQSRPDQYPTRLLSQRYFHFITLRVTFFTTIVAWLWYYNFG